MKKLKKKRGKMRWAVSKRCEEPPQNLWIIMLKSRSMSAGQWPMRPDFRPMWPVGILIGQLIGHLVMCLYLSQY